MKPKITKFKKIMLCFLIIALSSCEKDLYEEAIITNSFNPKITLQKVSFSDVQKNTVLVEKLSYLKNKTRAINTSSKNANPVYDFKIDTEKGERIDNGTYHSYTFPVIREFDNGLTENVVLSLNEEGSYSARLVQYSLTLEDKIKYLKNEFNDFSKITKFIDLELSSLTSRTSICAEYSTQNIYSNCSQNAHGSWNTSKWEECSASIKPSVSTVITVNWKNCGGTDSTSGGINSPIDGENSGGISGGGSELGSSAFAFDNAMLTSCIIDDIADVISYYISDLSEQEILFLENRINYTKVIKLRDFLVQNNFSMESRNFVQQMITQMILNPNTQYEINASFLSPFNIEKSTITDATTEGKKFNEVYDALLGSPEFKKLFLDVFDGTKTRFNVKFVIGDITSGANGNTDTDLSNPTLNIITISPAFLKRSNKMEIAKTILHECIHAYLNVKMVDPTIGMSISNLNNMEFCDVVNQKYNNFLPGQNQHNFIYNFMLPTMAKVLSEVKDKLVSTADETNILPTIIFPNQPDYSQRVHFNWVDCLNNLALSGLQSCSFFQNEIGTFFPNGEPNITVNSVKMNNYNQYNKIVRTWLK